MRNDTHASGALRSDNRSSSRRRSGMSLVEIMVAMVVLSFGLLGVAALQVRAITEGSGGQHLSIASAIASNRIEELSTAAWADADLNDDTGAWSTATDQNMLFGVALDQTYSVSERISWDDPNVAAVSIKTIEVRVNWDDNKRQGRQVVLTSARLREIDE